MRVLQSLYAFAGNAPPQLAVTRQLVGRGHQVLVLGHEAARARIEATGATLRPFRLAYPDLDLARPETDPIRDWEPRTQLGAARRFRDRALINPMADATTEAAQVIAEWAPDIVVLDFLLVGVATAAEAAGLPPGGGADGSRSRWHPRRRPRALPVPVSHSRRATFRLRLADAQGPDGP